jgi:hypothetical protein
MTIVDMPAMLVRVICATFSAAVQQYEKRVASEKPFTVMELGLGPGLPLSRFMLIITRY